MALCRGRDQPSAGVDRGAVTHPVGAQADRASSRSPLSIQYGEQKPLTLRSVAETRQKRFPSVTWREGTKGARRSRFLALPVQSAHDDVEGEAPGTPVWLLVEWPHGAVAPTQYFLCDLLARHCQVERMRS